MQAVRLKDHTGYFFNKPDHKSFEIACQDLIIRTANNIVPDL